MNKLKALHARNEYLLNIEVANSAIHKYFADDVSDLMDVSTTSVVMEHAANIIKIKKNNHFILWRLQIKFYNLFST